MPARDREGHAADAPVHAVGRRQSGAGQGQERGCPRGGSSQERRRQEGSQGRRQRKGSRQGRGGRQGKGRRQGRGGGKALGCKASWRSSPCPVTAAGSPASKSPRRPSTTRAELGRCQGE